MPRHVNQDDPEKFVQSSRGPLGDAYEAVRKLLHKATNKPPHGDSSDN